MHSSGVCHSRTKINDILVQRDNCHNCKRAREMKSRRMCSKKHGFHLHFHVGLTLHFTSLVSCTLNNEMKFILDPHSATHPKSVSARAQQNPVYTKSSRKPRGSWCFPHFLSHFINCSGPSSEIVLSETYIFLFFLYVKKLLE